MQHSQDFLIFHRNVVGFLKISNQVIQQQLIPFLVSLKALPSYSEYLDDDYEGSESESESESESSSLYEEKPKIQSTDFFIEDYTEFISNELFEILHFEKGWQGTQFSEEHGVYINCNEGLIILFSLSPENPCVGLCMKPIPNDVLLQFLQWDAHHGCLALENQRMLIIGGVCENTISFPHTLTQITFCPKILYTPQITLETLQSQMWRNWFHS